MRNGTNIRQLLINNAKVSCSVDIDTRIIMIVYYKNLYLEKLIMNIISMD